VAWQLARSAGNALDCGLGLGLYGKGHLTGNRLNE
jgi:hypothetical protein